MKQLFVIGKIYFSERSDVIEELKKNGIEVHQDSTGIYIEDVTIDYTDEKAKELFTLIVMNNIKGCWSNPNSLMIIEDKEIVFTICHKFSLRLDYHDPESTKHVREVLKRLNVSYSYYEENERVYIVIQGQNIYVPSYEFNILYSILDMYSINEYTSYLYDYGKLFFIQTE